MINLYNFGDRRLDKDIQYAVMKVLEGLPNDVARNLDSGESIEDLIPSPAIVDHIYNQFEAGLPVRQMIVDLFVRHGHETWMADINQSNITVNHEFYKDVTTALLFQRRPQNAFQPQHSPVSSYYGW